MSQAVLVEVTCDADGCDQRIRGWHWSGLGATSTVRSTLRSKGWVTIKTGERSGGAVHFCPGHPEQHPSQWRSMNRANACEKWAREA